MYISHGTIEVSYTNIVVRAGNPDTQNATQLLVEAKRTCNILANATRIAWRVWASPAQEYVIQVASEAPIHPGSVIVHECSPDE